MSPSRVKFSLTRQCNSPPMNYDPQLPGPCDGRDFFERLTTTMNYQQSFRSPRHDDHRRRARRDELKEM
jgi:hypothetical protein